MTQSWRKGRRVAVIGAGPGGVSTAIAMLKAGYDVRLYERNPAPKPLGGAVLLSVPVLAVLRHYGVDIGDSFGQKVRTEFRNPKGQVRVRLGFNAAVERAMGIEGWHYGILRSSAFERMMDILTRLDPDCLQAGQAFQSYEDTGDEIVVRFDSGSTVTADLVVGADGIRSGVSRQAFGDPGLFHVGLRVWLAWCEDIPDLPKDVGALAHGRTVQASYFPMKHDGKPGFEWWIVEKSGESAPAPPDTPQAVEAHLRALLRGFSGPVTRFIDHTDVARQVFRWEIYNRPSLPHYTRGRVACVGDAVHPVSPYAAYGMGMAIEDGYFLARSFEGRDLDPAVLAAGFARYEAERVAYCNHQVEFARKLGNQFHHAPAPVAWLRDQIFDRTGILQRLIEKDYLADAEKMSMQLRELHVAQA
ncbi:MAG: FAD-dependent monooxygenase [Rhodobacter sp.]|nr:FAD-dependent monooxygenase [Paracoccaceae bacterium]MCC0078745.1 FAD-dependent monooxygenase [Rhodobacter sp.]